MGESDPLGVTWPLNMESSVSLGFEDGIMAQGRTSLIFISSVRDVVKQLFPEEQNKKTINLTLCY